MPFFFATAAKKLTDFRRRQKKRPKDWAWEKLNTMFVLERNQTQKTARNCFSLFFVRVIIAEKTFLQAKRCRMSDICAMPERFCACKAAGGRNIGLLAPHTVIVNQAVA